MLSPRFPAAVVAGNVEVSRAVTDTSFAALGALGSAQGTMNNLTFGDETYQYYETICSGAPAGPGFDGASAVHTHMTNSRWTDPEVLESRFPVVLEDFHIRRGSGGQGRWRGRRRHAEAHPLPSPDAGGDLERPSRRRQSGHDGRERRRTRPQFRPPQRRAHRDPARLRRDACRSGRSDRDRDADGRGMGKGSLTRNQLALSYPRMRVSRLAPDPDCRTGFPRSQE